MTKILIAEDDRDIRELIAISLTYAGYEVVSASDGQQAVDLAIAEKPDLIMLDVRMPRLSGFEALERVKKHPEFKDVPVVILSAKGQDAEIQNGLDLGALQYILKPFAPDELIAKIDRIVKDADKTTVEHLQE